MQYLKINKKQPFGCSLLRQYAILSEAANINEFNVEFQRHLK